jgi:hypothetical protein
VGEALPSSLRGAVLVGLAVIVGIIGLQILDDSGGTASKASPASSSSTSTTGAPLPAPHPVRSDVKVKVYNASGVQNAGQSVSDKLKGYGYSTLPVANYATTQKGTVVQCRPGFEGDGAVIAFYGIGNGATTAPFPSSPPAASEDANCIVIVGTT